MSFFSFRQQFLLVALLFTLLLLLVPHAGFEGDVGCWVEWATYGFEHGLGNVYQVPNNNYNPLYHYVLWGYGQLCGSPEAIRYNIHWLKAFTLVFDFAGAFWAASVVPERGRRFGLALGLLLNIAYLYDTLLWEQVDAIYSALSFGAVVLAVRQRSVASVLLFTLALAAKTQAIMFLPTLGLLWLPVWQRRPQQLGWAAGAAGALGLLLLAPFIWGGWENYLPHILNINVEAANKNPVLSMNAYNLWHLVMPTTDDVWKPDTTLLLGFPYHRWGLLLFAGSLAVALLPVALETYRRLRGFAATPTLPLTLLSTGLVPLLFAFFNTQMHERYWHASMLFLAAYGFLSRNYWPVALVFVAYFLNLEGVLHFLGLHNYHTLLFHPRFVAALFGLAIVFGLLSLYRLPRVSPPLNPARSA